jgi:hypothetical protein
MAGICAFLPLHRDEPESSLLRRPAECSSSFFSDSGLTFDPRRAPKKFRQALASSARVSGAGSIQSTAPTSSLTRGSLLFQRATNDAMTKCVRIRLASWKIASTCRLKAMTSASTPISSMSSRAPAAAIVSPTSTGAPGEAEMAEQRHQRSAHD